MLIIRSKKLFFLLPAFVYISTFPGCRTSGEGRRRTANTDTPTLPSDCQHGIAIFNQHLTQRYMADIALVSASNTALQEQLRATYPEARDAWNRALKQISSSYGANWSGVDLQPLDWKHLPDWRSAHLEDYQKFFLLLAEARHGPYPVSTKDTLKKSAWVEAADIKKRLDASVRHLLDSNCRNSDPVIIRRELNPLPFPARFEDCLAPGDQ